MKKRMGTMSEGALSEFMGHVRLDQELKAKIDELEGSRKEVRNSIEMILRAHNLFEVPLDSMGLKVKLSQNRESRRMDYKRLMSEREDLYEILTSTKILKISKPSKMYRLDIRGMKK